MRYPPIDRAVGRLGRPPGAGEDRSVIPAGPHREVSQLSEPRDLFEVDTAGSDTWHSRDLDRQ